MKPLITTMMSLALFSAPLAGANEKVENTEETHMSAVSESEMRQVSPVLARYFRETLQGDLWKRPGLSARDRSLVTVAVLITRNQFVAMPDQFALALDHGVKPAELSEAITHLAFYTGWGNVMSSVHVTKELFRQRNISAGQLPPERGELLPLDEKAEAARATMVETNFGMVSPGVVQYTTDALFKDLWLRPALAPRDRSLITVSALIAEEQVAQLPYHLNRAMDNGLTRAQMAEVLTQLAFYAGWPKVFSALPVVKEVFEKRPADKN